MLSYLLYVVSLVNHSGFNYPSFVDKNLNAELGDGGGTSGGLVVKMGPVMNIRVADVKVIPGAMAMDELPVIARKGSLFEAFSHNRVYAIRYGK
jgi:hypothetical protein